MLVEHDPNDNVLMMPEAAADPDPVALAEQPVWLGVLAIDLDLAALARAFRFGARLEQTRHVEPDVDANRARAGRLVHR